MPGKKRNLLLPEPIDGLLDLEGESGPTITATVSAAVYWYFKRLEASQRELARMECREWLATGKTPPSTAASEVEEILRRIRRRQAKRGTR